jgi:hypothetical protein
MAEPERDVASIIETCDGSIVMETMGVCDEHEACTGPFVVLYQRGLRSNPRTVQRSHHNLLSSFKIKCTGVGVANVPWRNFSWISKDREHAYVDKAECTDCGRSDCSTLFSNVSVDNIKVAWMHEQGGNLRFQWYVAFTDDGGVLTRVPNSVVTDILKCLTGHKPDVQCTCGRCTHPVMNMTPSSKRSGVTGDFCTKAVKLFTSYRSSVHKRVKEGKSSSASEAGTSSSTLPSGTPEHMEEGMCAVCLEDTFVSTSSCIQKKCSLKVCADCHKKTMGLCPLCDRSKLSTSATFQCNVCSSSVHLNDYGFPCITCKKPELCNRCYKSFSQCLKCELSTLDNSDQQRRKKRKTDYPCAC